jgi:hypothetical protein
MRDGLSKDSGPLCRAVSNAPTVSLSLTASDLGDILEGALLAGSSFQTAHCPIIYPPHDHTRSVNTHLNFCLRESIEVRQATLCEASQYASPFWHHGSGREGEFAYHWALLAGISCRIYMAMEVSDFPKAQPFQLYTSKQSQMSRWCGARTIT